MDKIVCHCFGYTAKDIEQDLAEQGWSSILESILVARRLGGCRCAELSPRGA